MYHHCEQLAVRLIAKIVVQAMQHLSLLSSLYAPPYMTYRESGHSLIMATAYEVHAAFSCVGRLFSLVNVEVGTSASVGVVDVSYVYWRDSTSAHKILIQHFAR